MKKQRKISFNHDDILFEQMEILKDVQNVSTNSQLIRLLVSEKVWKLKDN